jgi:hypothetical protein
MLTFAVDFSVLPELRAKLHSQRFRVYDWNAPKLDGLLSLLQGLVEVAPFKKPKLPQDITGFSEFTWYLLAEQKTPIAIVWTGSSELKRDQPEVYAEGLETITGAVDQECPDRLSPAILFLIGDGPDFPGLLPEWS